MTKIKEFMVDNFLFGENNGFNQHTSFMEEGIIDSMGIMELIVFLEESYNIKIKDEELIPQNLDSINKIVKFIEVKTNNKQDQCAE